MVLFAEFLHDDGTPHVGSDSVCPIDGRFGLPRALETARMYLLSLRYVQPKYRRFRIVRAHRYYADGQTLFDSDK
jgi:hypothetical protein